MTGRQLPILIFSLTALISRHCHWQCHINAWQKRRCLLSHRLSSAAALNINIQFVSINFLFASNEGEKKRECRYHAWPIRCNIKEVIFPLGRYKCDAIFISNEIVNDFSGFTWQTISMHNSRCLYWCKCLTYRSLSININRVLYHHFWMGKKNEVIYLALCHSIHL